jgi:hypothetical protein
VKINLRRVRTVRLSPMQEEMCGRVYRGEDSNRQVQQELKVVNVALPPVPERPWRRSKLAVSIRR